MKKTVLIAACAVFAFGAQAQDEATSEGGLYVDVNLGYNFSLNSQSFGSNESRSYAADGTRTDKDEAVTGSLGKGMVFGANVGYMFNQFVGAELGINYLLGGTTTTEYTESSAFVGSEYSYTETNDLSANMLQFSPSIVLTTGSTGISPYAKFGIVLGMAGKITKSEETTGTTSSLVTINSSQEEEFTGGLAFGWSAAFGARYAFNDKMSLFGELNMVNMAWAPTTGELTAHTDDDGVSNLSGGTTRDINTEFVDELTEVSTATIDETKPRQALKQNFSFSSLGLKIGLHIAF